MATLPDRPGIELTSMSQLALAVDKEDDWTGLTDAAARRKRQNRLNVRAYRRRKAQGAQAGNTSSRQASTIPECQLQAWWNEDKQMIVSVPASFAQIVHATINPKLHNPILPSHILPHLIASDKGKPRFHTGILFPLSSDHLITLIQYNVLRACLANLKLLGLVEATNTAEECGQAVVHIMTDPVPYSETGQPLIPPPLHPTLLQRTVEHLPWIDIIPHPVWRDNLIRATGTYDEDEICSDVVGGLWDDNPGPDVSERGIIAWSPPWDMSGWEASEGFLKKWGWLLQGCEDILEHTNRWRRMRGEDDLVVEI